MNNIWREGYTAFRDGLEVNECPYPDRTLAFLEWHDGWMDAQEEAAVDNCVYNSHEYEEEDRPT